MSLDTSPLSVPKQILNCYQCDRKFPKQSRLQQHIDEIHLNIKKFVCLICSKTFKRNQHLKRHELTHSGLRPWICSYQNCPMLFSVKHHLTRHIQIIHEQIKSYLCESCQFTTCKKKTLNKHIRECQNNIVIDAEGKQQKTIKCLRLKKKQRSRQELNDILFVCKSEGCLKSFTRLRNLRNHTSTHHEHIKRFECTKCHIRFAHMSSVRRHESKCQKQQRSEPLNFEFDSSIMQINQ